MMLGNRNSLWVADGSSVEYLDLRVCEFQREKIPRLVSALNLSLLSTPPTAPYVPLIPVMERKSGRIYLFEHEWTATVFLDFSRNILRELEMNCEIEIAKFYLNHLTAFCHYVEKFLYPAQCFRSDISTQIKYRLLRNHRNFLIDKLKLEATQRLAKIVFDKVRIDYAIITNMLDTGFCSWKKLVYFSFKSDPAITDSILSHLLRDKTTEQLIKLFPPKDLQSMIRTRPKHLLVFLNYGFKNIYKPVPDLFFLMTEDDPVVMPRFRRISIEIINCILRKMPMNKREVMILELCTFFIRWNERNFRKYFESMCYIWRSIPDVHITLSEIKHTLLKFLGIENEESVEDLCHELQRLGFNNFEVIPQTREEPKSKEQISSILNSLFLEDNDYKDYDYEDYDDEFSMHSYLDSEDRYSRHSELQLLEGELSTNSRLSKNPEIPISVPRGVFLPYTFSNPMFFIYKIRHDLRLLTDVAKSLVDSGNSTIQPHNLFLHNLGPAEEVLARTSQFSEDPVDPIRETRNPLQFSREAVRDSVTQNSQWTEDSTRPKKENPEDLICKRENLLQYSRGTIGDFLIHNSQRTGDSIPQTREALQGKIGNASIPNSNLPEEPNDHINMLLHDSRSARDSNFQSPDERSCITPLPKQFNYSQEAMIHDPIYNFHLPENSDDDPDRYLLFSQALDISDILISGHRFEARPVRPTIEHIPNFGLQFTRRLPELRNLMRDLRSMIGELLIRHSQWTEDSIPQTGEESEGKIRNASIPSSKLPEKAGNHKNLLSLLRDSRSVNRNECDSDFQLPDKGFRINPQSRTQFSYARGAMTTHGAIYNSSLPEETEYHQNANFFSQPPQNPEIPISLARNLSESRIRTVMARILNMPELPNSYLQSVNQNLRNTIRDSLIRNLQLTEESDNTTIQTSSLFLCNPGAIREVPNHNPQFPGKPDYFNQKIRQSENLLPNSRRAVSDCRTLKSQWTGGSADIQTRSSQFLRVPENPTLQTSNQFLYRPGINEEARIRSSQLSEELVDTFCFPGNPLQNFPGEYPVDPLFRNYQFLKETEDTGLQPRRLLHYARCVIRDALIHNSQLPHGIILLRLPSRLQSYLKLEL